MSVEELKAFDGSIKVETLKGFEVSVVGLKRFEGSVAVLKGLEVPVEVEPLKGFEGSVVALKGFEGSVEVQEGFCRVSSTTERVLNTS